MTVKELHRESMRFIDLALLAGFDDAIDQVKKNYLKAFELEKKALTLFIESSNQEPTRSILIRSAANLAVLCGQKRQAEKLIFMGLAGDISEELANEFKNLFQNITLTKMENTNTVPINFHKNKVYHLVWARKKGMCWRLIEFDAEKNIAYMETPETKKRLVTKLSDLRNTQRNANL